MKQIFERWRAGWLALTFQEKHSVAFSLAGVAATFVFGVLAAVLGWAQYSEADSAANERRARELRERNRQEIIQANVLFSGPHADDHDDIVRMLEEHVLEHVETRTGPLQR